LVGRVYARQARCATARDPIRERGSPDALDRLEAFASVNGPRFYGVPVSTRYRNLVHEEIEVPFVCKLGPNMMIPFHADTRLRWRFVGAA
jgi:dihydroorotase